MTSNNPVPARRGAQALAALAVVSAATFAAAFTPIGGRISDFVEQRILGREPLVVSVEPNADLFNFNGGSTTGDFIIPMSADELPPPPPNTDDCTNRYTWAHNLGGFDYYTTYGQFSLTARSEIVTVLGGRVRIVEELPPIDGTIVGCESGGGITVRHLYVDVDSRKIEFYLEDDNVPRPLALRLAVGETETIQFWALGAECSCRWQLELNVEIDGEPSIVTIDNNGEPFSTYGVGSEPYHYWSADEGRWITPDDYAGG